MFAKFSRLQFSCSVLFCFLPSPFKFLVECSETEQMSLKILVNTLQAFIEGSTLGEFHARLQALLVFHCHVLLMPQVAEKGKLLALNMVSILYLAVIFQAFQTGG